MADMAPPKGHRYGVRIPGLIPEDPNNLIVENLPWAVNIGPLGYAGGMRNAAETTQIPYDQHTRVQAVFKQDAVQTWVRAKASKVILIQDTIPNNLQNEEFSIISPYVGFLAAHMKTFGKTISITFFCKAYTRTQEDEHSDNRAGGEINVAMLRSLCFQLLEYQWLDGDVEYYFQQSFLDGKAVKEASEGDLDQLIRVFEDVVGHCWIKDRSVVCFIDGIQALEDWANGVEVFGRILGSFKTLAGKTKGAGKKFDFKVLITSSKELNAQRWNPITSDLESESTFRLQQSPAKYTVDNRPKLTSEQKLTMDQIKLLFPKP